MDEFTRAMEITGMAVDGAGVVVIVLGAIAATIAFLARLRGGDWHGEYQRYRQNLGRAILLGLELLIAGDIIRTVAVEPNLENVGVLAAIVLIRTFLSFSLEVELEGRLPWQARAGTANERR